ncbi:MAG: hypothetical protein AAF170_04715 [Bacteroidota bacterium]
MRLSLVALLALSFVPAASAQTSIGAQLGDPTGVSLKLGDGSGAILVGVGWDFSGDDAVNLEGHYLLRSRGLQGNRQVRLFYGPGIFASFGDIQDAFGVSVGVGLETELVDSIEVYGLVSPRLQLINETDFDAGGGIGVRVRV